MEWAVIHTGRALRQYQTERSMNDSSPAEPIVDSTTIHLGIIPLIGRQIQIAYYYQMTIYSVQRYGRRGRRIHVYE